MGPHRAQQHLALHLVEVERIAPPGWRTMADDGQAVVFIRGEFRMQNFLWKMFGADELAIAHQAGAFEHVAQLAHVARERIGAKHAQRRRR